MFNQVDRMLAGIHSLGNVSAASATTPKEEDWVYSMNPTIPLSHDLLHQIAEIDAFNAKWSATNRLTPERLNTLRKVATIESIGSSTRIEGVKLTDSEIEKLLTGFKVHSFLSRDEQEVSGYAETMELVFNSYENLQLTENHIKQLHSRLLKFSHKDERHRGEYKKFPNSVAAFDSDGKSAKIVFETASPFDTPGKMAKLVEWTNHSLQEANVHPLLVLAVFTVNFLAIHPFQDGNGRLSRILTTLLLLRSGYTYAPYSSLEHVIEANKERYYLALRRAQGTLDSGNSMLHEWLLFFLQCLKTQKINLEKKMEKEFQMAEVSPLSSAILVFIKDHGKATMRDIVTITKQNRNTIKVHLRELVRIGRLLQQGKGKGTWYKLG